jgi:steroid delta-isomerase
MSLPPPTAQVVAEFENLRPDSLPDLLQLYQADASFKDPFNEVIGRAAIERIFRHMFDTLDQPRFKVLCCVAQGDQAFLTWNFSFQRRPSGQTLCIHGASHLRFGTGGLIAMHRDYWDAAEELYTKLPLLGSLMRWLRRRLSAG